MALTMSKVLEQMVENTLHSIPDDMLMYIVSEVHWFNGERYTQNVGIYQNKDNAEAAAENFKMIKPDQEFAVEKFIVVDNPDWKVS